LQLQTWDFLDAIWAAGQSIGLHFAPLSVGMAYVSIGNFFEHDNQTAGAILIPTHYVRIGETDVPRDNFNTSMAWDNNLSGVDIIMRATNADVEGSYMIFG
jgi:hypothetical protein